MKKLLVLALLAGAITTPAIARTSPKDDTKAATPKPVQKNNITEALDTIDRNLELVKALRTRKHPTTDDARAITNFALLRIQLFLITFQESIELKEKFQKNISPTTKGLIQNEARSHIRQLDQDITTLTEALSKLIQDALIINTSVLNKMEPLQSSTRNTLKKYIQEAHDAAQKALKSAMTPFQQNRVSSPTRLGTVENNPKLDSYYSSKAKPQATTGRAQ